MYAIIIQSILIDDVVQNGGHCQPVFFEHPHDPSIGHFELKNFETLQSLIDEKDIDCEFVTQPGEYRSTIQSVLHHSAPLG